MPDAPRLDDLIATVRDRAPEDALEQLREAAALKSELDDLTDALLGHFVDQARRAGASWTQIGQALGVTKQAAQQKHTSTDSAARRIMARLAPKLANVGLRRFTPRAKAVVVAAQDVARGFGHDYVGTEHLLLALYAEPEGIAARVLDELGVDRGELAGALLALTPQTDDDVEGHIPFTPRSKKALEGALEEAMGLGHNYIGTEHILLGVLAVGDGLAARLLAERGVAIDDVRAAVVRLLTAAR